jgi:hypothetical protein
VSTTITVDLGCHAVLTDPDDLLGQKVPLDLDGAPSGDATVVQVYSDPRGGLRSELEVPAAVGSRLEGARLTMPMPVRRWLHCRGLLHSPSWGLIYEQGTLLRPGPGTSTSLGTAEPRMRLVNTVSVGTRDTTRVRARPAHPPRGNP